MNAKILVLTVSAALLLTGTAWCTESGASDARPYMGVLLDPTALGDLLVKHLGLSPGQGVRIKNVQRSSGADKAGLERDDLIIGFEGEDVDHYDQLVEAVRKAGVGTEVSLEIVHLGKRKTVKLKLKPFEDDFDWKYPPEPETVESWRPGRIFRLGPGDKGWSEMLSPDSLPQFKAEIDKLLKEVRVYQHSNGQGHTITIEGNPNDEDATVTVRSGDSEYRTTAKDIDKLPEEYREAAEQALKNARKSHGNRRLRGRAVPPYRRYDFEVGPDRHRPLPPFGPGEQMFDRIQKQMREFQERIEGLEKRHDELLNRLDKQKPQRQKKSRQSEKEPRPRI